MKEAIKRLVPAPILRAARRLRRKPVRKAPAPVPKAYRVDLPYEERFPARHDTEFFEIGDGMTLAVYWKQLPLGSGPAFSIHAGAAEPLKFDCFGPGEGHYHTEAARLAEPREDRIWLPEPTRRAQVDRALFEIERNAVYFMSRSPHLKGGNVRPDPEKLSLACDRARILAYRFLDTIPQLRDPPPAMPEKIGATAGSAA